MMLGTGRHVLGKTQNASLQGACSLELRLCQRSLAAVVSSVLHSLSNNSERFFLIILMLHCAYLSTSDNGLKLRHCLLDRRELEQYVQCKLWL